MAAPHAGGTAWHRTAEELTQGRGLTQIWVQYRRRRWAGLDESEEEFHRSWLHGDLEARDGCQTRPHLAAGLLQVGGAKIKEVTTINQKGRPDHQPRP